MGQARSARQAIDHGARDRDGHSIAEHREPGGSDRRRARPEGSGLHVLGEGAGPPDDARGVRADRRARDAGRSASCVSRTSRGSSWAPRITRSSATSTENRARSSRFTSCRDRTRSRRRRRVKNLLANQKARLPQGVDYTIALDTTRAVSEGIKEIIQTLLIAIVLVIIVVYIFLQGWRATLIPLLAVPVSLVGDVRSLPRFRLLHQHALAVRSRPGHRTRRRRRHRGRGGGRAPHRRGHVAEGSDPQGDGGDLGTGRRHRPGALGRLHSHGIHPRDHRPALSAVRADHRHLGHSLRFQRADPEPRPVGAAAAATPGEPRTPASVLRRVQPGLQPGEGRLRAGRRRAHPKERRRLRAAPGVRDCWPASSAAECPGASFRTKTRGFST